MRKLRHKILLVTAICLALNLQGCASSVDTFLAGAVVGGIIGGSAAACSRYCY